jgi:hypothetical protein
MSSDQLSGSKHVRDPEPVAPRQRPKPITEDEFTHNLKQHLTKTSSVYIPEIYDSLIDIINKVIVNCLRNPNITCTAKYDVEKVFINEKPSYKDLETHVFSRFPPSIGFAFSDSDSKDEYNRVVGIFREEEDTTMSLYVYLPYEFIKNGIIVKRGVQL